MGEDKTRKLRVIWAFLLMIAFPFAIIYPFYDTYLLKHVAADVIIPFDFSNALLFTSSILFGFT